MKIAALIWIHPKPTLKVWFYEGERDRDTATARALEVREVREVRERETETVSK